MSAGGGATAGAGASGRICDGRGHWACALEGGRLEREGGRVGMIEFVLTGNGPV